MRMAQLTRWVLAHKRIVVVFWLVLTLVGMASAGSATKALKQKFSVPGKEGWITNQQIQHRFRGTGGDAAPLLAVVTLQLGRAALTDGVSVAIAAASVTLLIRSRVNSAWMIFGAGLIGLALTRWLG